MNEELIQNGIGGGLLGFIIGIFISLFIIVFVFVFSYKGEYFTEHAIKNKTCSFRHSNVHYVATFRVDTIQTLNSLIGEIK